MGGSDTGDIEPSPKVTPVTYVIVCDRTFREVDEAGAEFAGLDPLLLLLMANHPSELTRLQAKERILDVTHVLDAKFSGKMNCSGYRA